MSNLSSPAGPVIGRPCDATRIAVPDEVLHDLTARLRSTRLPPADARRDGWARGTDTDYLAEVVRYWADGFDWREQERRLNELPQFHYDSAAGQVHFVHVRSRHREAVPLLLTHGWPWTYLDYAKTIEPLTDPTAHGGSAADAFHVIIPSVLGFGFSVPHGEPPVWWQMADVWADLMTALGYEKFVAAGGDWGAYISAQLGHRHPDRLIGVHLLDAALLDLWNSDRPWDPFEPVRAPLTAAQRPAWLAFERKAASHVASHVLDPQTVSHALSDSPAGLCSWLLERRRAWTDCGGDLETVYSRDELLTGITIYWVTNTIASSISTYARAAEQPWRPQRAPEPSRPVVSAPTALSTFRHHARLPGPWADTYYDLRWRRVHDHGGHFSPAEVPLSVITDLRDSAATFRRSTSPS